MSKSFGKIKVENIEVEIEIDWIYEANYGADADGRRGMAMWLVDEVDWHCENEADLDAETKSEIQNAVDDFVEHDAETPDDSWT